MDLNATLTPPASPPPRNNQGTRLNLPPIKNIHALTDIQRVKHLQLFEKRFKVKILELQAWEKMLERKEKFLMSKDEMLINKENRIECDIHNRNAVADLLNHHNN